MRELTQIDSIIKDEIDIHIKKNSPDYGKLFRWPNRNGVWGFGIGLSDTHIFDAGLNWVAIKKINRKVELITINNSFPPDETIQRLRDALYCFRAWEFNFIDWNSEHLSRLVATGNAICEQKSLNLFYAILMKSVNKEANEIFEIYLRSRIIQQEESLMPDPKTIQGQVILFNKNLRGVLIELHQRLTEVIARPAEFGLQPNGLSVALIRAQQEKKNESVLVKEIKKISTKALSLALKETFKSENNVFNGFNVLHWGMMLNRSEVVQYLLSKGFEGQLIQKNEFGLTPMQMAVVAGSRTCFMSRFASIPEFSEMDIQYINEQDEKLKFTLNELHLALMSQQVDIVRDIFATLKNRHKNIQTEIKGIGNLLHLLVYVGNSQAQQTLVNVDVESMNNSLDVKVSAVDLLQLILQQGFSKKILIKLLTKATNNHEGYSPLSLAAKYGQIGLLHALIRYLKIHVTESNGLEEVTKAFYVAAQHGQNETVEFLIHFYQFKPSNTHSYYETTLDALKEKSKAESHYQLILGLIRKTEKEAGHQQYIAPLPVQQSYENLVLSGGGGKGFIYPYALQALETCLQRRSESASNDFIVQSLGMKTVVRVAGTSAGAMFALALALGYTPKELETKLATNFAEFLESDQLEQVTQQLQAANPNNDQILIAVLSQLNLQVTRLRALIGNVKESSHPILKSTFEFIKHPIALYNEVAAALAELKKLNQQFNGFSKGEKAYAFLKQLLIDKNLPEDLTFGELAQRIGQDANKQKGYKHLHVAVTNLTQSLFEVLSTENPLYKNYLILDAVRASMSYPLVFMPHHLKIKEGNQVKVLSDEYIDGGALRNYPIDEFDFKQYTDTDHTGDPKYPELNKKTLGFRFADHSSAVQLQQQTKSETLLSRFMEFVSLYSQAEALINAHIDREYHRSIVLDTGTIATFTFKQLTETEKRFLKQQADLAVGEYFKTALHQGEIIVPSTLQNQRLSTHTSSQVISLTQSATNPAAPNLQSNGSHESEFEAFQKRYFQEVNDKRLVHQLTQEAARELSNNISENNEMFFDPFQSFATEVGSVIPDVSPSHIKKTTITPPLDTYSLIQTPQIVTPLSSGSTLNLAQTQTKKYLLQELLAIKNKYGEPLTLPRLHLQHAVRLAFKNFLVDKLMPFLIEHKLYNETQPKSIFISYAWAIEDSSNYNEDKVYEGYVEKIAKDLERIGCKVYLDRWFDQPGNVLTEFLELMGKADFFIPVGTHLYLSKYEKRAVLEKQREHVVRTEGQMLNYIASYSSQWQNTIMPILLEGTSEETLPILLRSQLPLELHKEDYFDKFFALIKKIYGIDNRNKEFEKLIKGFYQAIKVLAQSETDLEQHIRTLKRNGSPLHQSLKNQQLDLKSSSALPAASSSIDACYAEDFFTLSSEQLLIKAKIYMDQHKADKALTYLNQLINKEPRNAEYCYLRAKCLIYLNRHYEALTDLNAALRYCPKHIQSWVERGFTLEKLSDLKGALCDYSNAIKMNPQHHFALCQRGGVYMQLGYIAQGRQDYEASLAIKADDANTYCNRGKQLLALRSYVDAIADFNEAIRLQPTWKDLQALKAEAEKLRDSVGIVSVKLKK